MHTYTAYDISPMSSLTGARRRYEEYITVAELVANVDQIVDDASD